MSYKKLITAIIIVSFFSFLPPQKAHAQYVDVVQLPKEFALDTIAVFIAKIMLKKLTAQTVNWINSGFKGSPAYVTDPGQLFLDTADSAAANYLSSTLLNRLCSPFRASVRLALVKNYLQDKNNYTCSLIVLQNNYDAFTQDFTQGGWDGWFEMTQTSAGNPFSAYFAAESGLLRGIGSQSEKKNAEISQGAGFMSQKSCKTGTKVTPGKIDEEIAKCMAFDTNSSGQPYTYEECQAYVTENLPPVGECKETDEETTTPGSVINKSLGDALGNGWKQLEAADEINEIVTALVTQLIGRVVGGIGDGLRGASKPGPGGTPSYTDLLTNEPNPPPVDVSDLTLSPSVMRCTTDPNTGDETCEIIPGTVTGPPWVTPITVQSGPQCADTGEKYAGDLRSAMDAVIAANPSVAALPNTEANNRGNARIFLALVETELINMGFNATDEVLNGNSNPSTGDIIAVWKDGDQLMERYDAISGGITSSVGAATQTGFIGFIPLDCTATGGGRDCGCRTNTSPGGGGGGIGAVCTVTGGVGNPAILGEIDLSKANIVNSPNVTNWAQTTTITNVNFTPDVRLDFSKKQGPGIWPDQPFIDDVGDQDGDGAIGQIYYTTWLFIKVNGQWVGSGFNRVYVGGGEGGSPLCTPSDWYYDSRWAPMPPHQIKAGEEIGFMVTAGDARNNGAGGTILQERSNAVIVKAPAGFATFSGGTNPPPGPPPPPPGSGNAFISSVSPTTATPGVTTITITGTNLTNQVSFYDGGGGRNTVVGSVNSSKTQTTVLVPSDQPIGNATVKIYQGNQIWSNGKLIAISTTGGGGITTTVLDGTQISMAFNPAANNWMVTSSANGTGALQSKLVSSTGVPLTAKNIIDSGGAGGGKIIYAPNLNKYLVIWVETPPGGGTTTYGRFLSPTNVNDGTTFQIDSGLILWSSFNNNDRLQYDSVNKKFVFSYRDDNQGILLFTIDTNKVVTKTVVTPLITSGQETYLGQVAVNEDKNEYCVNMFTSNSAGTRIQILRSVNAGTKALGTLSQDTRGDGGWITYNTVNKEYFTAWNENGGGKGQSLGNTCSFVNKKTAFNIPAGVRAISYNSRSNSYAAITEYGNNTANPVTIFTHTGTILKNLAPFSSVTYGNGLFNPMIESNTNDGTFAAITNKDYNEVVFAPNLGTATGGTLTPPTGGVAPSVNATVGKWGSLAYNSIKNNFMVVSDDNININGRIMGNDNVPVTSEFQVYSSSASQQLAPKVAFASNLNKYLVVWVSFADSTGGIIYGRFVTSDGAPTGSTFPIYKDAGTGGSSLFYTNSLLQYDVVNNKFVLTWEFRNPKLNVNMITIGETGTVDAVVKITNSQSVDSGAPTMTINTTTGKYCVAYSTYAPTSSNAYTRKIMVREYSPMAGSLGSEVLVVSKNSQPIEAPSIVYDSVNKKYLVAWDASNATLGEEGKFITSCSTASFASVFTLKTGIGQGMLSYNSKSNTYGLIGGNWANSSNSYSVLSSSGAILSSGTVFTGGYGNFWPVMSANTTDGTFAAISSLEYGTTRFASSLGAATGGN